MFFGYKDYMLNRMVSFFTVSLFIFLMVFLLGCGASDSTEATVSGCMNSSACNFNSTATADDGSCVFVDGVCDTCEDGQIVDNDSDNDGICDDAEVVGCMDVNACNYNANVMEDDGSCVYVDGVCETCENGLIVDNDSDNDDVCDDAEIAGCMTLNACNYNAMATNDDGSCVYVDGVCETCENGQIVDNDSDNDGICNDEDTEQNALDCSGGSYGFTHSPMDVESIYYIAPLGNSNPFGGHIFPTVHTYIYFAEYGEESYPTHNVYAPGDMDIYHLQVMEYVVQETQAEEVDYSINFELCDGYSGYLKHIKSLEPGLTSLIDSTEPDNCNSYSTGGWDVTLCEYSVSYFKEGGDLLGTVGGVGQTQSSFDLGVMNDTVQLSFINQTFYPDNFYHMVCPYDLYEGALKESLESKLGYYNDGYVFTPRTIEPICGDIEQDEAGTLRGNWVHPNYNTNFESEDYHIAFYDWNYDPVYKVVSIGRESGVFDNTAYSSRFIPNTDINSRINRDYVDVVVDGMVYCYDNSGVDGIDGVDNQDMRLLVTLYNQNTLYIAADLNETSCASIPTQATFIANYSYLIFER